MYQRDTDVEMKETLARLSIAFDRLIEVVAKDETSKSILESLKEKGAKDIKEVPTSDVRAEDIKVTQGTSRSRSASTADATLNYSTINRLNTAFRALQGDLGAFQKTLMNSIVWGNKAQSLAQKVASITPEQLQSPIKSYKQAEKWFLDKMGGDRNPAAYKALGDKLAPTGDELFKFLQAGFDPKDAGKVLTKRNQEALIREAQAATMRPVVKPGTAGAGGAQAVASGIDMAALARTAATVAIIAAPLVVEKMAVRLSDSAIAETRKRYGHLDAKIATDLAKYDMGVLVREMRIAPQVSKTFQNVLSSREEFNKTLEPLEIAATNLWNTIVTGLTHIANYALKPLSVMAENANNSINERARKDLEAAFARPVAPFGAEPVDSVPGVGIMLRAALGQLQNNGIQEKIDEAWKSTSPGSFALQIRSIPVCPPRRFVP